jgi:hypothetical protein
MHTDFSSLELRVPYELSDIHDIVLLHTTSLAAVGGRAMVVLGRSLVCGRSRDLSSSLRTPSCAATSSASEQMRG